MAKSGIVKTGLASCLTGVLTVPFETCSPSPARGWCRAERARVQDGIVQKHVVLVRVHRCVVDDQPVDNVEFGFRRGAYLCQLLPRDRLQVHEAGLRRWRRRGRRREALGLW